ncbi:MAG TPA: Gfo/Idh/MocA family oxidoreductase [Pyrinomonadaceae bacterium]|nr:Gfo/Idh/MocA family oxidoreductase [Pyrinomonadaceae bacterium]
MTGNIKVGVIGCGYWGPNLLRNFAESEGAELKWICDLDSQRLNAMGRRYPAAEQTSDYKSLLADPNLDAVVIATPVWTHFLFAQQALEAGKHVLVEKPLTSNVAEASQLVEIAERLGLTLMVDHTFVYTGAVRKIKEIVESGELGDLLYFDATRINLGLFQNDINVVWDLAPHDLSIMDYVIQREPESVTAVGSCHVREGIENIAYVILRFADEFMAHFHFNWLSPVKIRHTLLAGSRKMVVYDDIEPTEKVRVYDSGVTAVRTESPLDREEAYRTLVSYRTGDVWVPKLDSTEALRYVSQEFLGSIREKRAPLTDGNAGLRVVRLLEAAQKSISSNGAAVRLSN